MLVDGESYQTKFSRVFEAKILLATTRQLFEGNQALNEEKLTVAQAQVAKSRVATNQ